MSRVDDLIEEFQSMDTQAVMEVMLDYADSLPELPEEYKLARDAGYNRVPECQTPVFLWVEIKDGKVSIAADAARESPTVRGFVSMLVDLFDGATPEEVLAAPEDLLQRLGLASKLGLRRIQGLSAVYRRIRAEVEKAMAHSRPH